MDEPPEEPDPPVNSTRPSPPPYDPLFELDLPRFIERDASEAFMAQEKTPRAQTFLEWALGITPQAEAGATPGSEGQATPAPSGSPPAGESAPRKRGNGVKRLERKLDSFLASFRQPPASPLPPAGSGSGSGGTSGSGAPVPSPGAKKKKAEA